MIQAEYIKRIRQIIEDEKMSDRQFAMKCGLKPNTFCNQLNGVRALSLDTIVAILDTCTDIPAEWLMRGHGDSSFSNINMNSDKRTMSLLDLIADLRSLLADRVADVETLKEEVKRLKELNNK